jgi:hypothetical protein
MDSAAESAMGSCARQELPELRRGRSGSAAAAHAAAGTGAAGADEWACAALVHEGDPCGDAFGELYGEPYGEPHGESYERGSGRW